MPTYGTHFSQLIGRRRTGTSAPTEPNNPPVAGDEYYDTATDRWYRYNGTTWKYLTFATTTSTSTTSTSSSTTTTSTSTTTTSTSSSTTTTSTSTTV